jgi:protein TonB
VRFVALAFVLAIRVPVPPADPPRTIVGSTMDCGKLLHYVRAVPPRGARQVHGEVKVKAWISRKGVPSKLELIEGHPLLVDAAFKAVKRWRYKPCVLNSEPVEVITTIVVSFTQNE